MVSVIIPTYNRGGYLKEAIESVLNQTIHDLEIIVIDDGSTDNTREIVGFYGNKVKYFYQENKERGAARNNGIVRAKGEYIALLDSDDVWLANHLELCLKVLNNNVDAGVAYSRSYLINKDGKIVSRLKLGYFNGLILEDIVSNFTSGGCNASSCLIKKYVFDEAGYFNEDRELASSGEDWETFVRMAACTKFVSTGKYTVKVRIHNDFSLRNSHKIAESMTRALNIVYNNPVILPKISMLRDKAYSSLYTIIAINYYASGDMLTARRYLKKAIIKHPRSIFTNKYLVYTFLRSLLGPKLSIYLRIAKQAAGSVFYSFGSR